MFMSDALYMSINVMYIIHMYIKLYKHNFEKETFLRSTWSSEALVILQHIHSIYQNNNAT